MNCRESCSMPEEIRFELFFNNSMEAAGATSPDARETRAAIPDRHEFESGRQVPRSRFSFSEIWQLPIVCDELQNRCVVHRIVIHKAASGVGRDNNHGNAKSISPMVHLRGRSMIVEASGFIPG